MKIIKVQKTVASALFALLVSGCNSKQRPITMDLKDASEMHIRSEGVDFLKFSRYGESETPACEHFNFKDGRGGISSLLLSYDEHNRLVSIMWTAKGSSGSSAVQQYYKVNAASELEYQPKPADH